MSANDDLSEFALEEEVKLILDASIRLKCSIVTRSRALLICHHFRRCVDEKKYDAPLVAAACISLSIKFNEEDTPLDAILLVFFCLIEQGTCRSTQDDLFKMVKKSVTKMEIIISRMLEFQLNHALAHEFLPYFLNDMKEVFMVHNIWDVIAETSMNMASDFYFSSRCLNYKAEEIASSVIHAALYMAGLDTNDDNNYLKLWMKNLTHLPDQTKLDIIEDIFKVCDVGPVAESKQN